MDLIPEPTTEERRAVIQEIVFGCPTWMPRREDRGNEVAAFYYVQGGWPYNEEFVPGNGSGTYTPYLDPRFSAYNIEEELRV